MNHGPFVVPLVSANEKACPVLALVQTVHNYMNMPIALTEIVFTIMFSNVYHFHALFALSIFSVYS